MRISGGVAIGVVGFALAGMALAGCSTGSSSSSVSDGAAAIGRAPEKAAGGGDAARPPAPASQVPVAGRQVIRSATIGLRVSDLGGAAKRVRDAAIGAGGFTASEDSESEHADFTLEVPAPALDRVVDTLAGIGAVTDRTAQAQDVTDQLVDTRSRLDTQQASVDRVRALLAKATSIGDVVSVEGELTKREADLESLEQRQAELSGQVALSAVTVHLDAHPVAVPPPPKSTGFVGGLTAGWHVFLAVLSGALVVLGAALPFAVLAVPLAWWWLRRRRAAKPAAAPNPEAS